MWCITALLTNILSIVFKYLVACLLLDLKIFPVSSAMFTCAQALKNLPGVHCDEVLQTSLKNLFFWGRGEAAVDRLVTSLCLFAFVFQHNNGQQEPIDQNKDLWSRLCWFYFKSAWFVVFSGVIQSLDWKSLEICKLLFQTWKKYGNLKAKSWKIGWSLEFFSRSSWCFKASWTLFSVADFTWNNLAKRQNTL